MLMKFGLFSELYMRALEYDKEDFLYIMDGDSEYWMDGYDDPDATLIDIHTFAHSTLRKNSKKFGMSRKQLSSLHKIPVKKLDNWNSPDCLPLYLKMLIDYTFYGYLVIDDNSLDTEISEDIIDQNENTLTD